MIYKNVLETIGKTPIVQLNSVGSDLQCNMFVKLEMFNPGGSVKDRTALCMIDCAEKAGKIKPGDTLIEPTSGNTGIGLALAAAVKGYRLIIVMPEKMSMEKELTLKALGAEIVRTPTEAGHDDPNGNYNVAKRMINEIPNSYLLDQWENPCNPLIHYQQTAEEILNDFGNDLHMVVMGIGTGGTISGVGRKLKERIPNIQIIGVDPYGSILGGGTEIKSYLVEGIGYDHFPGTFDSNIVDRFVKVDDKNSFETARRLIKEEGLLVGGSCGSATYGALQAAKSLKKGDNCLVILPDSIRNYMRKFLSDDWLKKNL